MCEYVQNFENAVLEITIVATTSRTCGCVTVCCDGRDWAIHVGDCGRRRIWAIKTTTAVCQSDSNPSLLWLGLHSADDNPAGTQPTHAWQVFGFSFCFFFWRLKLVGGGMMTDNATQCRVCIPVKWYWKSLTVHCVKLWEEEKYLKKISEKATNGPFSSIIRMCRLYIPPACPTQNLLGAFHVVSRGAAQTQHRASRPYGPRSAEDVCWNF